jgi:hypothetical protein
MKISDEKKSIRNIREYISGKTFIIPNYQRGYKWGIPHTNSKCSVQILLDDILKAKEGNKGEYFIQGVTVTEKNEDIILIDGQQRTTTLYLLLKYLEYDNLPTIKYDIRQETQDFLEKSKNGELESKHKTEDPQDIYFLKKAIATIDKNLQGKAKEELRKFILDNVKIFYITIDEKEATKVFSMLNGQKAKMKDPELIKAEFLRLISKNIESDGHSNNEWEINQARSKYAREWDRWNYWWNREEVRDFYNTDKQPMGLLLEYFIYRYWQNEEQQSVLNKNSIPSFENFKNHELFNEPHKKFKEMRELQKTFEDWFNDTRTHNYLGLIIKCSELKFSAFEYLRSKNEDINIEEYAKWALVGATHKEIIERNDLLKQRADEVYLLIKMPKVYNDKDDQEDKDSNNIEKAQNYAEKQLLRMNVDMDTQLDRRFDFSIWSSKSLEHIHPRSKVNELTWSEDLSIHNIGNLVLLYGRDNSAFGKLPFDDKKNKLFNPNRAEDNEKKSLIKSISLLHTVSVFSNNKWGVEEIQTNRELFLKDFRNTYNLGGK